MAVGGAVAALALVAVVTPAAAASSSGGGAPGGLAAAQAEAAQLATQIRVQGQQLDQLSEQADAATIHLDQVEATLASARAHLAATGRSLAAASALLRVEAIDAYTEGGDGSLVPSSPAAEAANPSLVGAYGEIIAGSERDAITTYRDLRHQQAVQETDLTAAVLLAQRAATQLQSDRTSAEAAASAERETLAGIQGHMAVLVAAAQAAQAAATEAQEKASLASQGQLPPATPPVVTTTAPSTAPLVAVPSSATDPAPGSSPAVTPAPPTTRPTGTRPTTTAAPTTSAAPTTTAPPTTPPTTAPTGPTPPPVDQSRAQIAIAYAQAQLGAPYVWGGAGPKSVGFDCSGLVMMAYAAAGVDFPHLAQDQYDLTARVAISQLQPGDLVFYGTPSDVYHVGLYIGGGDMIDAPETGQDVSIQNIYWSDLLSGGRVG